MQRRGRKTEQIRLQKYLAQCGVASRRRAEELIRQGKVRVNGQVVTEMGVKVSPDDHVEVDGRPVKPEKKKVYILMHKPRGYVTTVRDPEGRKTVMDLLEGVRERVYPVGRLDYDTSGLLLLTNDGDFANLLMHPRNEILKVYVVTVKGRPSEEALEKLRTGIRIDGYVTAPAFVRVLDEYENKTKLEITIHEGKNRQIRKMCEKIGHPVVRLKRIAYGTLELGDLKPGEWRYLTDREVKQLTEKVQYGTE
ncbi:rRNA pseudouridine synthase [Thermoclostridium stercorarium]|uniref:pseudouridine synthase n=1 Tax=Thermoclostridium stercorarium TaxID=1510 RepID=UPI0002F1CB00|nr:pseudouridine synthase [Thermoclostridium stercorarium]UZQ86339.1 rRNA pseudouridine synthase [Thermoclostridium stercorarium]